MRDLLYESLSNAYEEGFKQGERKKKEITQEMLIEVFEWGYKNEIPPYLLHELVVIIEPDRSILGPAINEWIGRECDYNVNG
jgi:hypothetical protein